MSEASIEQINTTISNIVTPSVEEGVKYLSIAQNNLATALGYVEGAIVGSSDAEARGLANDHAEALSKITEAIAAVAMAHQAMGECTERAWGFSISDISTPSEPRVEVIPLPEDISMPNDEMYAGVVANINDQLDRGVAPRDIEGFMTRGGQCYIFRGPDDTVIKIPRVNEALHKLPPGYMQKVYGDALHRTKGEKTFEQLAGSVHGGADGSRGAVATKEAPGRTMDKYTDEDKVRVSAKDHDNLVQALKTAENKKLLIDSDPRNLIHDPEKGFTIIDFTTQEYAREEIGMTRTWTAQDMAASLLKQGGALGAQSETGKATTAYGENFLASYEAKMGKEAATKLRQALREEGYNY